jgi:hypothetical protein
MCSMVIWGAWLGKRLRVLTTHFKLSNLQTFKLSKPSNFQSFKLSNFQTLKASIPQTFKLSSEWDSNIQTFKISYIYIDFKLKTFNFKRTHSRGHSQVAPSYISGFPLWPQLRWLRATHTQEQSSPHFVSHPSPTRPASGIILKVVSCYCV